MPGRTAPDAVRAYTAPLQAAVSCLQGVGKIVLSKRVHTYGDQGAWILNGEGGMRLEGCGTLFAIQRFELVPTTADVHPDYEQMPYRVSTREYAYRIRLEPEGQEMRWHWHPVGHSPERRPHIHPPFNLKAHIPGPRYAFEDVIEGCIALGAARGRDDWQETLRASAALHKKHQTWTNDPAERQE